ncbi:MAG: hypothetical protein CL947_02695 [Epsilonproteobacteria bacterium]|nr:hypothetical protein [Campylobacterota bacterium]|tara:strand:+ start:4145 stop:4624 length:480 start_codon:yes stop_codon:yes gene_type:complete
MQRTYTYIFLSLIASINLSASLPGKQPIYNGWQLPIEYDPERTDITTINDTTKKWKHRRLNVVEQGGILEKDTQSPVIIEPTEPLNKTASFVNLQRSNSAASLQRTSSLLSEKDDEAVPLALKRTASSTSMEISKHLEIKYHIEQSALCVIVSRTITQK